MTASDATEQGYGVCASFWRQAQVSSVGRVLERSRFQLKGHSARESALSAAGLARSPRSGAWETPGGEGADFSVAPDFPKVPAGPLVKSLWTPRVWG
eukprot:3249113-Pyramimonas_sp.AAC.1